MALNAQLSLLTGQGSTTVREASQCGHHLYPGQNCVNSFWCMQELRKETGQWVAKYARGGSARKLSARRFYIAVDALQGHLASNGQAPFPRQKIPVLQSNVQQAKDLIAKGK